MQDKAGLKWRSHPLIDFGIATITAFSEHESPEEVTYGDLKKFAKYAEDAYFSAALSGYLTVLFTANFMNPSCKDEIKRKRFLSEILNSFLVKPKQDAAKCTYCGRPSVPLPKLKEGVLPLERADRKFVPMITGEEVVNFFPHGRWGLSLCGFCLLALQALAIGAPMCSGRALVVTADDPLLTLEIVKKWLPETRGRIQLAKATGQKPPNIGGVKTRVIENLTDLEWDRGKWSENVGLNVGLTVYHLSNSGQGPDIDIFELPANIVRFLCKVRIDKYRSSWQAIVQRAWARSQQKSKRKTKEAVEENPLERRNFLYEELFSLPEEAGRFIRTYFLCISYKYAKEGDPRKEYSGWRDANYIKWELTELFLKEVLGMDKRRIEAIRQLGDRLADSIADNNDKRLWWQVYRGGSLAAVRNVLIKESQKNIKTGKEPYVSLDSFLTIFEEGEELARTDWRLAWDLTLIRVIEKLYEKKWFERNKEALESEESEEPKITTEV
jgi:CRISPR-associated protein Cst1